MILNIDEVNLESLDSVLDLNLPALDELTKLDLSLLDSIFPHYKKPFIGCLYDSDKDFSQVINMAVNTVKTL
jgi:hypothetical protein